MAARTPCLRKYSTRSTTSPSQQGVEGTDSRSGLDAHRRISGTGHVYLLLGKDLYPSFKGGTFYAGSLQATSRCAIRGPCGCQVPTHQIKLDSPVAGER